MGLTEVEPGHWVDQCCELIAGSDINNSILEDFKYKR